MGEKVTDIFTKCKRTHYSTEITPELAGETVKVTGWVHEIRDLGGIVFVLIRDKKGIPLHLTIFLVRVEGVQVKITLRKAL